MAIITQSDQSVSALFKAYRELMKLRIVALLVFTCITAMFVAAAGRPDALKLLATVVGGVLSAGGASALNQFLDRDMDAKMKRTAHRPIPSGRITPINALLFGIGLVAWSVLILGLFVNWLAAALALGGAIYYVVLYTVLLKRNTVANIVIGGGAGAMPVLVGWAAVTGTLSIEAFLLFAIVFYWTPPHSWALALMVNKDYAAVGVPMMPVARGPETTHWQILFYSVQLVLVSLLPAGALLVPGVEFMGLFYLISAVLLGVRLLYLCVLLIQRANKPTARRLYKYSSMYLLFLFLAMIIDSLL
ncbi:protoheme IX farnesyltransferase [Phototrophicus methaneseepsis]|uniref:Protoheme IX farnesyltransferase n=1 Tax=Phototrophicus methaneseepsis TaxID=2710758 RepID=A0A7S8E5L5_9CHLR|nr:heme o synthase [Phototrophicus methaneseepsis]QPC80799.1 protoheme IX farnesyltransferase [Phototrophicus methaneseepsis]